MNDLADVDYEKFWRRLQQVGLNAYEARSYVVLVGHPRFKALELAARARVPRQKIYEVLDSLVEKGFAQVVQETSSSLAVEPGLAIPAYLERQKESLEQQLDDRGAMATPLATDLRTAMPKGRAAAGTLDDLRIVNDPSQIAVHYRSMLSSADGVHPVLPASLRRRPPGRTTGETGCRPGCAQPDPGGVRSARRRAPRPPAGLQVRRRRSPRCSPLPLKLALFDSGQGLVALLDPVITRPSWTAVVFDHAGLAEAMAGLFEERWRRAITH
ncbi:MAG: helix-turn-helix domain-containing protein [Paludibaculum sp.]